jgi:hypothetical protein
MTTKRLPQGVLASLLWDSPTVTHDPRLSTAYENHEALFKRVSPRLLSDLVEVRGEKFYGAGYDDSDRRIPDITKATTLRGWQPRYSLAKTVELSMAYWLDNVWPTPAVAGVLA